MPSSETSKSHGSSPLSPQNMINTVGSEIRELGGVGIPVGGKQFSLGGRSIWLTGPGIGHAQWLLGGTVYDCSGYSVTAKDAIRGTPRLSDASLSETIRHLAQLKTKS